MSDDVEQMVRCRLCNKLFKRITNTHLKRHGLDIISYKVKFPDAKIEDKTLALRRVNHLRGKTYQEIYGKEKADKLKAEGSRATTSQMKDSEQREIRKRKCKRTYSEEERKILSERKTVHGQTTYRKRALEHYGLACARCGYTSDKEKDFVVYHRDFLNIGSELGNHSLENLQVLCKSCHSKLHNELKETANGFTGIPNIEKGVHYIFKGLKKDLGLDLSDPNFKDTPKRISRAYVEIFEGVKDTDQKVEEILRTNFPAKSDEMILVKQIRAFSMCPHHLLPVDYTIDIAYIPSEKGEVLGISKLGRLATVLAKRPVLQEQLVQDITEKLMSLQGCVGAACVAKGKHYCMLMRGVRQPDAVTITSSLRGVFKEDVATRNEFLRLIETE